MRIALALTAATLAGLAACQDADRSGLDDPTQRQAEAVVPRYADADRDGKVTRDEAEADPSLSASFDRYDTDRSGELDRAEFARLEAGANREHKAGAPPKRPRDEYAHPN